MISKNDFLIIRLICLLLLYIISIIYIRNLKYSNNILI